jgi:hypothetical protein
MPLFRCQAHPHSSIRYHGIGKARTCIHVTNEISFLLFKSLEPVCTCPLVDVANMLWREL